MITVQPSQTVVSQAAQAKTEPYAKIGRIHLWLTVQTIVVVLLTVNRLSSLTLDYVAANEFLRWVDLHNLLTLPLISLFALYWLKRAVERPHAVRSMVEEWLGFCFVLGVYLYGAGYGVHEMTNYLHLRFCAEAGLSANQGVTDLCRIVIFNDDSFSHWVWFAGFTLLNGTLLLFQAVGSRMGRLRGRDVGLLMVNGAVIGVGIFANLAFEVIGLDLYVVALLAALAFGLLWLQGRKPLFVYYATAYGLGLVATGVYKLAL
jgi:hypothetical protein